MNGIRGSFTGFTFNNVHSSVLGITRVIEDRAEKQLAPEQQHLTIQRPGADGMYYYGSFYKTRKFSVPFILYQASEEQLRLIRSLYNDKKIHDLIFDEEPYKVYSAKLSESANLQYLAFEDENGIRYYNGNGTFVFTCLYPFARSRYEYLDDYTTDNISEWRNDEEFDGFDMRINEPPFPRPSGEVVFLGPNFDPAHDAQILWSEETVTEMDQKLYGQVICGHSNNSPYINLDEWSEASRIPRDEDLLLKSTEAGHSFIYNLYNAGDLSTPLKIYFKIADIVGQSFVVQIGSHVISISNVFEKMATAGPDKYICINTELNAVYGCDNTFQPSNNLYNECVEDFEDCQLSVGDNLVSSTFKLAKIEFKYLYL